MQVDVVIVSDFRFPGGTSTAMASEVAALHRARYRVALMPMATPIFSARRMMHADIAALIRSGAAQVVRPGESVQAALCCLHHPAVFQTYPAVPPKVVASETLLVVHHPPLDATGTAQYPLETIAGITSELFGRVTWAPVGPLVRSAFAGVAGAPPLSAADWVNVVDPDQFARPRSGFTGAIPVVGRHSRPDPVKWPGTREEFLGAYPDSPDIRVRLMGWDERLDAVVGPRPRNWEILSFNARPVPDFLASLDYFSYFHGPAWVEAFGRVMLEAMSSGALCILPPHFAPVFREAAVYCEPSEVLGTVRALHADPSAHALQVEAAATFVREEHGPAVAVERVRERIGSPRPSAAVPARRDSRPANRILFLTSNGIGMGHLTRALAVARRVRPACEPVFVTMSKAFGVVQDHGIHVEYLPYFRSVGLEESLWAATLETELKEMLNFYRPSVFAFDGNVPYEGMIKALAGFPDLWRVWMRRPMWRPGSGVRALGQSKKFDVVVEPGEVARAMDRGLTVSERHAVRAVAPVRLLDRNEMLSREAARSVLGLNPERTAVLLLPGSGNNFAAGKLFRTVHDLLTTNLAREDIQVILGEWKVSNAALDLPESVRRLNTFPFSRFLNAFDFAVAMAGYNTFHENIFAALPTLFLANDNPEHDEQEARAEYGSLRGLCLAVRQNDPYALSRELEAILSPRTRRAIRRACAALPQENGAHAAAEFLGQLSVSRKPHAVATWAPMVG